MRKSVLYFCILYALSCVVTSSVSFMIYQTAFQEVTSKTKVREQVLVHANLNLVENALSEIQSDLVFLSSQNRLKYFLSTGDEETKKVLQDDYLAFSSLKKRYDQIRLLCQNGRELIRVNYTKTGAVKVPDDHLQVKNHRYYFKNTLSSDNIYVSPMDLNIEHNKIEQPFKPVMRFGINASNIEGERKGVILLNYLGDSLFDLFSKGREQTISHFSILNTEGYWLYGPKKEELWGFMFENHSHHRFSERFPNVWNQMVNALKGQTSTENGIFTWDTLVFGNEKEWLWKIVSHVPAKAISISIKDFKRNLVFFDIAIMILLVVPISLVVRLLKKRAQLLKDLTHSANFDKLTGLSNRFMFYSNLKQTIGYSERYNERFAILFIDIDGFKMVNDTLGHGVGDKLLQQIAFRLRQNVRDSDLVARLGGDEFILLLRKITTKTDAKNAGEKMVKFISAPFDIDQHTVRVGASIGISIYPDNGNTPDLLIRKADKAMYQCKKNGKNACYLCDSGEFDGLE